MSRHNLPNGVTVGYDEPLETFFAQKLDENDEEVWGSMNAEKPIHTIAELQVYLLQYGIVLTAEVCMTLGEDRINALPPSPLQLRIRAMFENHKPE